MIKKLIIAILIALPMSLSAQKFGVIDIEQVLQTMPEMETVNNQLQEASTKYQSELDKLREELDKKVAEYQTLAQDSSTPQSILERRMQEINELDQKAQQFNATAMQDLQRQQAQLMAPIEQKLREAVNSVGQDGGYVFIFPKGSAIYEGAMVEDVTTTVKARLAQ